MEIGLGYQNDTKPPAIWEMWVVEVGLRVGAEVQRYDKEASTLPDFKNNFVNDIYRIF